MERQRREGVIETLLPLTDPKRGILEATADASVHVYPLLERGTAAAGPEEALALVTATAVRLLGDGAAHERPGALKPGEVQYAVVGVLIHVGGELLLLAEENYPAEQHRLRIKDTEGMPGLVLNSNEPQLIVDTDLDPRFTQILKTTRMGSAIYAPMRWRGRAIGVLILGAQARGTYRPVDLEVLTALASASTLLWMAHGGPHWLADTASGG